MKKLIVIVAVLVGLAFAAKCTFSNVEVYYEVTATQPGSVFTEYTTPNGVVRGTYDLPHTSSVYVVPRGAFISVTCSRYTGSGTVTLKIFKEGSVWKNASISGAQSATISGTI